MMTTELKQAIQRELPVMFREDAEMRQFILDVTRNQYAEKRESESRFDRMMDELRRDREENYKKWEEQNRKWDEQNRKLDEQNRKWDEQNRKWDEQNRKWHENQQALNALIDRLEDHIHEEKEWREAHQREEKARREAHQAEEKQRWEEQNRKWEENQQIIRDTLAKLDRQEHYVQSSIGAIGSRWGFQSEGAFRNALAGILEESFGVQVLNINEFDERGEVFGHPDQVEIDVMIKNGLLIICELKSSMSRSDVYTFERKITFYERRHECTATRRIIITPMIREDARRVAAHLNMEVFSYAGDVIP